MELIQYTKKRFEVERKVKERSREDKLDSSGGDSGEDGSEMVMEVVMSNGGWKRW
ncbi:hypothetical protein F2Q68_00015222 [Brassica cretica]|uniref:Uncharacterized protein n=1 Tax=Brassica cretica TaxID=69181 RepID=A0A8S9HJS4_BRACR|nr:hypothetical protein F2Q68_00015222 [Brassica cretica]